VRCSNNYLPELSLPPGGLPHLTLLDFSANRVTRVHGPGADLAPLLQQVPSGDHRRGASNGCNALPAATRTYDADDAGRALREALAVAAAAPNLVSPPPLAGTRLALDAGGVGPTCPRGHRASGCPASELAQHLAHGRASVADSVTRASGRGRGPANTAAAGSSELGVGRSGPLSVHGACNRRLLDHTAATRDSYHDGGRSSTDEDDDDDLDGVAERTGNLGNVRVRARSRRSWAEWRAGEASLPVAGLTTGDTGLGMSGLPRLRRLFCMSNRLGLPLPAGDGGARGTGPEPVEVAHCVVLDVAAACPALCELDCSCNPGLRVSLPCVAGGPT
jgi:hypothetical protein